MFVLVYFVFSKHKMFKHHRRGKKAALFQGGGGGGGGRQHHTKEGQTALRQRRKKGKQHQPTIQICILIFWRAGKLVCFFSFLKKKKDLLCFFECFFQSEIFFVIGVFSIVLLLCFCLVSFVIGGNLSNKFFFEVVLFLVVCFYSLSFF